MAGFKAVTRKLVSWHGREEEFSNVVYFGDGALGLSPSEAEATAVLNALLDAEKLIHSSAVRFLGAAAYKIGAADTFGDTPAISIVELSASGNLGSATSGTSPMYRECAVDLRFLLGGRRYLRSMYHCCAQHGYDVQGVNATAVSAIATPLKDFAQKMLSGPWPGGFQRIAPNGDRPTAIMYNPYLEHRQFHRYRKRNAGLRG